MKLQALFATTCLAVAVAQAAHPDPWKIKEAEIETFDQPEPQNPAEKAAVRLKPILTGCFSYPAVDKVGHIGKGIEVVSDDRDFNCEAPKGKVSQVYGRVGRLENGQIGIMYSYYFLQKTGNPSPWHSLVVFIQELEDPKIMGCSLFRPDEVNPLEMHFEMHNPCQAIYLVGESIQLQFFPRRNELMLWENVDKIDQKLIMWEQLSKEAQDALNDKTGYTYVPVSDNDFNVTLHKAYLAR